MQLFRGHEASAHGRNESVLAEERIRIGLERVVVQSLSFLSTTTLFVRPVDITLSELAIEMFLPADAQTAALLAATS